MGKRGATRGVLLAAILSALWLLAGGQPSSALTLTYSDCKSCHVYSVSPQHHTPEVRAMVDNICSLCHNGCLDCHSFAYGATPDPGKEWQKVHTVHINAIYNAPANPELAQIQNCESCHVGGAPGGLMREPFGGCALCHVYYGYQDPLHAKHTDLYQARCDSCHGPNGCNECHQQETKRGLIHDIRYPGATGHDYHTNTLYIGCKACHTSGVPGGPMREQFADCAACHFKRGYEDPLHSHHTGNLGVKNCNSCHSDQPSPGCTGCHGVTVEFKHATQHDQVFFTGSDCASCHTGSLITIHEQGPNTPAYCTTCHLSSDQAIRESINQAMAGSPVLCSACHSVIHGTGNQPPTAAAGPDHTVTVGQAISFSGSGSSDADGSIVAYAWDFGDGTTASGITASKTYDREGTFTVTLTVTDNQGAIGIDAATVTVTAATTPPPPSTAHADQVLRITNLKYRTYGDSSGSRSDVTSMFKDGSFDNSVRIENDSDDHEVVAMRVNTEAQSVSQVKLKIYVRSLDDGKPQTVRIYPYQSNANDVDRYAYLDFTVSTQQNWVELDVTPLKSKMDNFGWMKFRITCTSKRLYVAEGMFVY